MKFYGNANLQQNELQNAALSTLTTFPDVPVVGQLAFVNSIVYICVGAGALPVWVPLTREITSYTHSQSESSSLWNITHNLNTTEVNIQVYGIDNKVIIPDEILVDTPTTAKVYVGTPITGKAVVVSGSFEGNPKPAYAFTYNQSQPSQAWIIQHDLGYHPIVRIFIGLNEVQPSSIVHNTANRVTVTFTSNQVGYARLL
jgi:hypothetical protein